MTLVPFCIDSHTFYSAFTHLSHISVYLFILPSSVVKVPQKTLLMDALKEETEMVYDFCMCNPPFFANQLEAKVKVHV